MMLFGPPPVSITVGTAKVVAVVPLSSVMAVLPTCALPAPMTDVVLPSGFGSKVPVAAIGRTIVRASAFQTAITVGSSPIVSVPTVAVAPPDWMMNPFSSPSPIGTCASTVASSFEP